MIELDVTDNMERAKEVLGHIPGAAQRAAARSLKRALATAKATAGRSAAEVYAVKSADVKRYLRTSYRGSDAADRFVGVLQASSEAWELSKFPHKPKRAGTGGVGKPPLRVQILRGRWSQVPGAFVVPLSGVPTVVSRAGRQDLPIRRLAAVNPAIMLRNERVREKIEVGAMETFYARMAHEVHRALEKEAAK